MALRPRSRSRRPASRRSTSPAGALVAAAKGIDLNTEADRAAAKKRNAEWQTEAWRFFDEIGECNYAASYFGNALSRLNLYVGVRPNAEDDPVPLEPEGDKELGYDAMEAVTCIDALDRLDNPQGGKAEILRRLGINLFVSGEALLCGRTDDLGERWDLYSTDELQPSETDETLWALRGGDGTPGEVLPKDALVKRIWRPHPRYSAAPTSPIRSALGICDELLILTKAIKGSALSRLSNAGWLPLPNSMRTKPLGDNPAPPAEEGGVDQIVTDFINVARTGIEDPASAAARVPVISWVNDDVYDRLDASKFYKWTQDADQVAAQQRAEQVTRFAVAIDLPPEVITGKGDMNHWGAFVVNDDTFRHLEPTAILAVQALTMAYLLPYLQSAKVEDPARFVVWYDAARLIARPNREEVSKAAHQAFVISDATRRAEAGYTDDDKPTDDEVLRRIAIARATSGREVSVNELPADDDEAPLEDRQEAPPENNGNGQAGEKEPAAVAGGADEVTELRGVPETLGRMESGLLAEMHAEAETAVRRALERANARLRSLASRDKTTRRTVEGIPVSSLGVAPALGPAVVERLATGDLFAGAWTNLEAKFLVRTGRAVDEVLNVAQTRGRLTEGAAESWREQFDRERRAGWAVLFAELTTIINELLYRPEPHSAIVMEFAHGDVTAVEGETDGRLVPPGVVRGALIRAGGGGDEATGMIGGALVGDLLYEAGIVMTGYRWQYGDPSARLHPFEAHARKDSDRNNDAIYTGRGDARLRSTQWPGQLWPGDHKGCLCVAVRAYARLVPVGIGAGVGAALRRGDTDESNEAGVQ